MEKGRCVVLIAEDEEIERDSLKSILHENFHNSLYVHVAKHGVEALQMYETYHPDVVMMDINMPGLNGLEAISKMKEFGLDSHYLILTSYDYFAYAQEALRLGVEEFLLKPSNPITIVKAISQILVSVHTKRNEQVQKTSLIQKFAEMRPLLEHQCLYTILSGAKELYLQEEFRRLNISVREGLCFIVYTNEEQTEKFQKIKKELDDVGYVCLHTYMNLMHIYFVLSNFNLQDKDVELIEYIMAQHHLQEYKVGIGAIQKQPECMVDSYRQALRNLHYYDSLEPFQLAHVETHKDENLINIQELGDAMLSAFLRQEDSALQKILHDCSMMLLGKDIELIKRTVDAMLAYVVERLEVLLDQEIPREDLPEITLTKDSVYQNLEVQMYYVFHGLFQSLQHMRYQQSSVLVKKALLYIQQNFHKSISLNDLAKHLQVTPFYVSKVLKQHTGKNFTDIVSETRIEKAKEYLREHQRVKEVTFAVGFQSQSYFAKTFKKIVGITPTEYQESFM